MSLTKRCRAASRPAGHGLWLYAGVVIALGLHTLAGHLETSLFAQTGNTSFTTSTTTSASVESPPTCGVIGSSREVQTIETTTRIGPACIGVGDRDVVNPSPACGGAPPAAPPVDPGRGTVFIVVAGTQNFNTHVHTETITCVAAVPAVPWPALAGLGGLLTGAGAWWLRRRRT